MSWKNTIQKIDSNKPSWRDSIQSLPDDVSTAESILRGAAQGASLGFADEITGGIESLLTDKSYEQARDESRKNYKSAQDSNPISYGAGEIGGGLATALVPGLNTAKLGTLSARVAANASLGALAGLGTSDSQDVIDQVKDAATGAALAGGISLGVEKAAPFVKKGLGYLGEKASDLGDEAVKKIGKVGFGVDEKATENYLKNSIDVNRAYPLGELADSVLNKTDETSALNEMRKKVSDLSSKAWETLSEKRSLPRNDIANAIADAQQSLMIDGKLLGKNQKMAYNNLETLLQDLKQFGEQIPEPQLKSIIQNLDENVNWNNPDSGVLNDKLKQIRGFIDTRLKNQNNDYLNAMKRTEDTTKALQEVQSVFQNRQNPENYDKFNKQVKNLINKDDMSAANRAVNKIQEHTGYDLKKDIVDSWTKSQFEKGDVNGSRKTLMGGAIGTAAGSVIGNPLLGGAIGSSVGFAGDRYAGPIFKKLLDGKITAQEFSQTLAPRLGKFAAPLLQAAQRGNSSLAATHFILQQNNPEYRKAIQNLDKEDDVNGR